MAIVLTVGAEALAALMAADRQDLRRGRTSSCDAAVSNPSPVRVSATRAGEGTLYDLRNEESFRESAGASRVSHSQTTSADQSSARNALSEARSRFWLRSIFARQ